MHESSMSDDQSGLDKGSLAEDHCTEALPSFGVIAGDVPVVRDFVFRSSNQKWYYDLDHNGVKLLMISIKMIFKYFLILHIFTLFLSI